MFQEHCKNIQAYQNAYVRTLVVFPDEEVCSVRKKYMVDPLKNEAWYMTGISASSAVFFMHVASP